MSQGGGTRIGDFASSHRDYLFKQLFPQTKVPSSTPNGFFQNPNCAKNSWGWRVIPTIRFNHRSSTIWLVPKKRLAKNGMCLTTVPENDNGFLWVEAIYHLRMRPLQTNENICPVVIDSFENKTTWEIKPHYTETQMEVGR